MNNEILERKRWMAEPMVQPVMHKLRRTGFPEGDCSFRKIHHCSKKNKNVAIDARNGGQSCWERLGCDDFEIRK